MINHFIAVNHHNNNKCKTFCVRSNNKSLAVFVILLLGLILPLSHTDSVSAYSASITTNNDITLDISPSGDGVTGFTKDRGASVRCLVSGT